MGGPNSLESFIPLHLRDVKPYIPSPPDAELMKLYNCKKLHRLNNNENVLGPCPAALRAVTRCAPENVRNYPSGDAFNLRRALGERFGLDPERVVVGNGSNEVIGFVLRSFCEAGDSVAVSERTFAVCEWLAAYNNCKVKLVPLDREHGNNFDGLLAEVRKGAKLVYVSNPNNPTGSFWGEEKVERFLNEIAGRAIVIMDEAYLEYLEGWESLSAVKLLEGNPNLVVFKTFSKIHALAGLRIGYALCSREMTEPLKRTRIAYSVGGLAQMAAQAAIEPASAASVEEHLAASRALAREGRRILVDAFDSLKLRHIEGEGNFAMVELPFNDGLAYRMLMTKGYMLRTMTGFRFPNWLRVTCSTRPVMEGFCEALAEIIEAQRR